MSENLEFNIISDLNGYDINSIIKYFSFYLSIF